MTLADTIFKENIKKIMEQGVFSENARPRYKDGNVANSKYITGSFAEYDLSKGEFPITTLRPIAISLPSRKSFGSIKTSPIAWNCSMTSIMFTTGMIGKLAIRELLANATEPLLRSTILSIKSFNSWKPILGIAAISSLSGIMKLLKKQMACSHALFKPCLTFGV